MARARGTGRDRTPLWLFADQLGPHFHHAPEHREREIVVIRSDAAFAGKAYHRQKLHLVLAALYRFADEHGDRVHLIHAPTYREGLRRFGRTVVVHEPNSHAADRFVRRLHEEGLVERIFPTPGFALPKAEFAAWARGRKRFLMEDFYHAQRRRFEVLVEGADPVGGQWNFDHENRHPPPHTERLGVPAPWQPRENDVDDQVRDELDRAAAAGAIHPVGVDGPRRFAVTHDEARRALRRFLDARLPTFGPQQDAMLSQDWAMSHALLSVPLNLGLLDPLGVVRQAERRWREGRAPLAGTEGFIRQVLRWRVDLAPVLALRAGLPAPKPSAGAHAAAAVVAGTRRGRAHRELPAHRARRRP